MSQPVWTPEAEELRDRAVENLRRLTTTEAERFVREMGERTIGPEVVVIALAGLVGDARRTLLHKEGDDHAA